MCLWICLCDHTYQLLYIATVGIIIAQIIRRTQLIEQGYPDPFPIPGWNYAVAGATDADSGQAMMSPELVRGLEEADSANAQNRALLRLVYVLEKGILKAANLLLMLSKIVMKKM